MTEADGTVRYSIVSAVHDVERYLDEFIASVEQQTLPLHGLEVVMVDDGSTDGSGERLLRWQRDRPDLVRVLTQPNGGPGSARNLGLAHATGTWVAFCDPDDRLERDFLERVDAFLQVEPEVDLVQTRLMILDEETGEVSGHHPLRAMFRDGDVARHLDESIDFFASSAAASFFRRSRLADQGARFDVRLRPSFEDAHFTARYLLAATDPVVGFVATAKYLHRRRSDRTTTKQSVADPGRYTTIPRHGYLDLLQHATTTYGAAPGWLQSLVLYDLSWFFRTDDRIGGAPAWSGEVADAFHTLLGQVVDHLDPTVIRDFQARPLKPEWRLILLHAYRDGDWHQDRAVVSRFDEGRGLVRLSYYFTGSAPDETVQVRGRTVTPYAGKVRDVISHDRVLLHERIVWVSSRASIRLRLDDRDAVLDLREPEPERRTLLPGALQREIHRRRGDQPAPAELEPEQRRLVKRAGSRAVRRRFHDAWVLMDRVHDADDSGEHLFRHLRSEHPDINAWFVVEEGTPDWERLKKEGLSRVVAFGSQRWKLLMLNCRHLISSHADEAVVRPPALAFAGTPWRFTFLNHGVIKDDLSSWLNRKPIEVFVTSTQGEFDSVAGDHTTYQFTSKETVLSGMPRFDLLHRAGKEVGPDGRDLVLIAPTWRNWLLPPLLPGSQRRPDFGPEFFESEFLDRWLQVLSSPEIEEACRRNGRTLAFLPHPNLQDALQGHDLPPHVERLSFVGNDVRTLFARSALLVTDYSSMAFNAAYIDRPVVYYQFDRERMRAGDHVGRAGYFDYERDGFGPLVTSHDDVVAQVVGAVDHGPVPTATYLERIAETFPQRDGRCSERVTRAILDLDRELSVKQAGQPPVRT